MFLNGDYKMNTSKGKTIQYKRRYNIYRSGASQKKDKSSGRLAAGTESQELLRRTIS
jgi:hypothetical protein